MVYSIDGVKCHFSPSLCPFYPYQICIIQIWLNEVSINNTLWLSNLSYSDTLCLSKFPYLDMNLVHIECIVSALLSICSPVFIVSSVIWTIHVMNNTFMCSWNLPYSYLNVIYIESIDFVLLSIFSPYLTRVKCHFPSDDILHFAH